MTGAFAFIYANHTVTVTIGPGVQLTSGYNTYLQSNIDEDTQSSASSSIAGTPEDPDHKDSRATRSRPMSGRPSISLAIDVADESNTATATVGDGSVLNAPDATFVISEVEYPLLTTIANLPTSVGELVGGLRGGSISPSSITSLIAAPSISEFAGFFGNGYSDATAQAEKTGIAGSITFLFFTNDAETHVGNNVSFNQTVSQPAASQVVVVYAENLEQLIGGAGQIKGSAQTGVSINPASKSDTSSGVGGSLNGLVLLNTTEATIGTGAIITTGPQGGTAINTDEYVMLIGFANGGASADSTSVGGSINVVYQTSNTLAQLGTGAQITGGPVSVYAESLETAIGEAGQVDSGHGIGVGISITLMFITRTTQSAIGPTDLSAPGNGGTNIDVSGGVNVQAVNDGVIWAFGVAGVSVSKQPTDQKLSSGSNPSPNDPTDEDDPLDGMSLPLLFGEQPTAEDKPQAKTGVAIAGAAALNWITDTTLAAVNDLATINPGAGATLNVEADQKTDAQGGTGAIAINRGAGSKQNVSIAGALSFNDINDTTYAYVIGVTMPAETSPAADGGALSVTATRSGHLFVGTVGVGIAPSSGKSVGVAGSVSWEQITAVTEAIVEGLRATLSGDASVTATDTTFEVAVGGALAVGGTVGIGASLGVNQLSQDTEAIVEPLAANGGDVPTTIDPSLTLGGGYTQTATDGIDVIAVALSAGVGGSAVAATIAINIGNTASEGDGHRRDDQRERRGRPDHRQRHQHDRRRHRRDRARRAAAVEGFEQRRQQRQHPRRDRDLDRGQQHGAGRPGRGLRQHDQRLGPGQDRRLGDRHDLRGRRRRRRDVPGLGQRGWLPVRGRGRGHHQPRHRRHHRRGDERIGDERRRARHRGVRRHLDQRRRRRRRDPDQPRQELVVGRDRRGGGGHGGHPHDPGERRRDHA